MITFLIRDNCISLKQNQKKKLRKTVKTKQNILHFILVRISLSLNNYQEKINWKNGEKAEVEITQKSVKIEKKNVGIISWIAFISWWWSLRSILQYSKPTLTSCKSVDWLNFRTVKSLKTTAIYWWTSLPIMTIWVNSWVEIYRLLV